jgi:hypothetical protein
VADSSIPKTNSKGKSLKDLAYGEPPTKDATPDDKAMYVLARYQVQNDHYVGLYETWSKAVLFLLGRHWLIWNKQKRRYGTDTDVPAWTQQPVTQVVYAVYRTAIAKLTKQKPALEIVPPSSDSDDRESAHIAEALITHLWRLCKIPTTIKRALGWFLCTGQVYLRVHWDKDAGKLVPLSQLMEIPHSDPNRAAQGETEDVPVPVGEDGKAIMKPGEPDPETGEPGEEVPDLDAEPHMVPEGEIAIGIESPLSVRYNPEAETPEDADEMFVARLWPLQRAAEHFDIDEHELTSGKDEDRGQYDDLMSSASAAQPDMLGTFGGASQSEAIGPRVLVIEYYRDRMDDFPNGRHWIVVGEKTVWPKEGDKEYPDGEAELPDGFWPPLIAVQDVPVPGQIQALGLIPQIVGLNEALNTLDGKILENDVQMAMGGKWIVSPDDRGLLIDSSPGQVLASKGYAEGKPPVQAEIKALPAQVYAERSVIMGKVSLVTGFDRQDLGEPPEGVTAGRAMLVQQEKTDSVYAPSLESWEHAYEEVGRRMITLAQRNYTESRDIQIRGERGKWEVRSFLGSDLSDGLDVRVQVGSSFPWSKAAQWDARIDVLKAFPGMVTSPTGEVDEEKFSKFMDTGASGLGAFESDENSDLMEVEREHAMFEAYDPQQGSNQLPQLAFWQSQPKHLAAHYDFMKRDRARYDKWKPEAQQAFIQHMQLTAQTVDQLAGQMPGGEQGAPQQGPPGGGPPNLQLMPGGQGAPSAQAGGDTSATKLTPGDFAAAGQ